MRTKETEIIIMAKKIYVNGGILIDTPFFVCRGGGCYFTDQPEGAELMETNSVIDGYPCLKIDNSNPQSIFNEYYAKEFLTSNYIGAEFYYKSYNEAYEDYLQRISDIQEVIKIKGLNIKQRKIINRLSYINIVASLETFICDTILTKMTGDEDVFMNVFNKIPSGTEKDKMQNLREASLIGKWEQKVIEYIMRKSYSNIDTIKKVYGDIFKVTISDSGGKMKAIFRYRHKLAHRNGRNKDNTYINISNKELDLLISNINDFIEQILAKI